MNFTACRTLTLICLFAGFAQSASALTFTTEDYPPFNMQKDGKPSGISTEVLQEALKLSGLTATFQLFPWERALGMAKSQADACVFSAIRNSEREPQFKWVGPVVSDDMTLFAKADSTIQLKTLDDAKKYKVGGYNGDAYGDFVEKKGIKVERVADNVQNLPKLMSGRIDLWVGGIKNGPYMAAREGYKGKIKSVLSFGDPKDYQMWLACNKGVPDATIQKLNDAVKTVNSNGTGEKIAKKYQ